MKMNFTKRFLALLIALVMIVSQCPILPITAADTTESAKTADPHTLNNWQDYYGLNSVLPDGNRGISTWKAGGVWTDKSVFADDTSITAAGLPTSLNNADSFLIALSALASNQQIVGQSSVPIDTMLVLDLSASMDSNNAVPSMIEAANQSIQKLLEMNVNNRVGVVLYSGNATQGTSRPSTATVILPLDRYTNASGTYLQITGNRSTSVSVHEDTRNSQNQSLYGSKSTSGGTYIQNGLYQAYQEFASMADNGVVQSGQQQGTQRLPFVILMTDGAPTAATTNYYGTGDSIGNSNRGDGSSNNNTITFLTQLTAAWIKSEIGKAYNNTPAKFYTLGMGTGSNEGATAVLDPSGSNFTLRYYWNRFNQGSVDGESVNISNNLSVNYSSSAASVGMNYVDRYWAADDAGDLVDAFDEIVNEIALTSAYSATLVQSGEADLDGYITVVDELGAMMQVKDIKGILLGDSLFTGSELAKSMNEGLLGSSSDPKEYGSIFVNTIQERLGITDMSVVQNLIRNAYHSGQLNYVSDSEYSNYIGWYGDADNAYLGFWEESYGDTMTGAPENAKYINKSYVYLGGTSGTSGSADMMHVIVMVRTNIETGDQAVLFRVPSSLIPMITYKVELEGEALVPGTDVTVEVIETDPIRLLYEVGLPDDINPINLDQKVEEYLSKSGSNHIHKNNDGTYTFYANDWGATHNVAPDISSLTDEEKLALTDRVAESHFIPNTANDRFYILEDSLVYEKVSGTYQPMTSAPQAGAGEYYFVRNIVTQAANQEAQVVQQYELLTKETIGKATFKMVDGQCYIAKGSVRLSLSSLALEKEENITGTLANSDTLWVYVPANTAENYNVYSFLGNNGTLTMSPATGLKVTKKVSQLSEGASGDEKFPIVVTINTFAPGIQVTDENGTELTDWSVGTAGTRMNIYLSLADGESALITGLNGGVTYSVTEEAVDGYAFTYTGATQTVEYEIVEGVVTNDPVKNGSLYITKEVVHSQAGVTFPTDVEFRFYVYFRDANGLPLTNRTFPVENERQTELTELKTDASGIITGGLYHGETIHIMGIPEGTTITVVEHGTYANYDATPIYRSRDYSGAAADNDGVVTIYPEQNATVVVTNTYTPTPTTVDLSIDITKNFFAENEENLPSGSFTFKVQKYENGTWVDIADKQTQIAYNGDSGIKDAVISNVLEGITYTKPGSYAYQVLEVKGSVPNVTYDRTLYTFTVVVEDVNGQLTATVTDRNNQLIQGGTYDVEFNNTYHTATVNIDIVKNVIDTSKTPVDFAGFEFVVQTAQVDAEGNWSVLSTEDGGRSFSVFSDAVGEARMVDTYYKVGTYYYIISEKAGAKPNWDYSTAQYKIKVVTSADPTTGDLSATAYLVDGDTEQNVGNSLAITFTNTYDPDDATVDLSTLVEKKLTGRNPVAGEFQFAIYPNNQTTNPVATGVNDANGKVVFTPGVLTFDKVGVYEYDIREISGDKAYITYDPIIYDLVITVTDAGDGTLQASYYFEDSIHKTVTFNNTYTAEPTSVVIQGSKTIKILAGMKELNAGAFEFGLYDESGTLIDRTTNLANGTFTFNRITYTLNDLGPHLYTVKEIAPDGSVDGSYVQNGLAYSGQSFTVTVVVTDNGEGVLSAAVTGNGTSTIRFENTYDAEPTSVTLHANKLFVNNTLVGNDFQYQLFTSNSTFTQRTLVTDQIFNDADGKITFNLGSFEQIGTYYFELQEIVPDSEDRIPGVSYDASRYMVTVQIVDSGNGHLTATTSVKHSGRPDTTNPDIIFRNVYAPTDTHVVIGGHKHLVGNKPLQAGEFAFELLDASNAVLQETSVLLDGSFAFAPITYTLADKDQTYIYYVREKLPTDATSANGYVSGNFAYDPTLYKVTVSVHDNQLTGEMEAQTIIEKMDNGTPVSAAAISFTNTHIPDPIEYTLEAEKTYIKGLGGNDFLFHLVSADALTSIQQSKYNDADGNVVFDPIKFTQAGVYTFTVTEEKTGLESYIRPSEAEYLVSIEVVNEGGVLRVASVYATNVKNTGEENLTFDNKYVMTGEDEVVLEGIKVLTGDRTQVTAGEFTFGLYNESGNLLQTVTNDADGSFRFAPLYFTEADTVVNGQKEFVYTVRELAGSNTRYTYDDTVYTVTVTVKDNDQGGIAVSHEITENGAAAQIVFTNTYTDPTPVTFIPTAKKQYNKQLIGGDFTFKLTGSIAGVAVDQEKTNDADGNVIFDKLSFPEAGVYTFKVSEVHQLLGFITYATEQYDLTITIVDINGTLSLDSVVVAGAANGTMLFTNVYNFHGDGEVELSGNKTLSGDRTTIAADEFTFGLYNESGNLLEAVKNDAQGNFAFSPLTYTEADVAIDGTSTFVYTVKEIAGTNQGMTYDSAVYTVTVTVKDNDQGSIAVDYVITKNGQPVNQISFANNYTITENATVVMAGIKTYTGKTLVGNDFSFVLTQNGVELEQVKNAADGTFAFSPITYTKADIGVHTYIIKELRPADAQMMTGVGYVKDGIIYDANEYTVEVTVADNGNGGLTVTKKVNNQTVTDINTSFDNRYQIFGTGELQLEGSKVLTGDRTTVEENEFAFGLYNEQGVLIEAVKNDAQGKFVFAPLVYTTSDIAVNSQKTYVYTIKEIAGDDIYMTYDPAVYTVTATVKDNGAGGIDVTYTVNGSQQGEISVVFTNTYTLPDPVTVTVDINKELVNKSDKPMGLDGFVFEIEVDGATDTCISNAEGLAAFRITLDHDDIGKTYTYKVSEKKGDIKDMTYDATVHTVTVKVEQNDDGSLRTLVNGTVTDHISLEFTNLYEPEVPKTGDQFPLYAVMCLITISAAALATLGIMESRKKA